MRKGEGLDYNGKPQVTKWYNGMMEAFSPIAPQWTREAVRSFTFTCPRCNASPREAKRAWLNRYAPVTTEDNRRKWQEFYMCECEQVWWAWSNERPPSPFSSRHKNTDESD